MLVATVVSKGAWLWKMEDDVRVVNPYAAQLWLAQLFTPDLSDLKISEMWAAFQRSGTELETQVKGYASTQQQVNSIWTRPIQSWVLWWSCDLRHTLCDSFWLLTCITCDSPPPMFPVTGHCQQFSEGKIARTYSTGEWLPLASFYFSLCKKAVEDIRTYVGMKPIQHVVQ